MDELGMLVLEMVEGVVLVAIIEVLLGVLVLVVKVVLVVVGIALIVVVAVVVVDELEDEGSTAGVAIVWDDILLPVVTDVEVLV